LGLICSEVNLRRAEAPGNCQRLLVLAALTNAELAGLSEFFEHLLAAGRFFAARVPQRIPPIHDPHLIAHRARRCGAIPGVRRWPLLV
jgi:hypothetical protein